uniref:Plasmid stabilization system protein n=1 Tax=mine drainage metagenome TaxID=410659 RepID=E6QQ64_9ZZZZ
MAFRLKFSSRALRETGEAQEWYELKNPGLGEEFIAAMTLQLNRLAACRPSIQTNRFPGLAEEF